MLLPPLLLQPTRPVAVTEHRAAAWPPTSTSPYRTALTTSNMWFVWSCRWGFHVHLEKLHLASGDALHLDVEKNDESLAGIVLGAFLKSQVVLLVSLLSGCWRTAANLFFFYSFRSNFFLSSHSNDAVSSNGLFIPRHNLGSLLSISQLLDVPARIFKTFAALPLFDLTISAGGGLTSGVERPIAVHYLIVLFPCLFPPLSGRNTLQRA